MLTRIVVTVFMVVAVLTGCSSTPDQGRYGGYYRDGGYGVAGPSQRIDRGQPSRNPSELAMVMRRLDDIEVRLSRLESSDTGQNQEIRRLEAAVSDVAAVAHRLSAEGYSRSTSNRYIEEPSQDVQQRPATDRQPANDRSRGDIIRASYSPDRDSQPEPRQPDRVDTPSRSAQPQLVSAVARTEEPESPPAYRDTSKLQQLAKPKPEPAEVEVQQASVKKDDDRLWQVVLYFDSRDELNRTVEFMKAHQVKDRYPVSTGGRHILYLGTFSRYSNAIDRRDQLSDRTGLLPKVKPMERGQST